MLVIKALSEDFEINDKKRIFFKKKSKILQDFTRYTEYINNMPFCVVVINKGFLESEKMQRLLNAYKGRVVVNENISVEPFLGFLFDETEYFIRAILSSLLKRIEFEKNINSIGIKYSKIISCEELFGIVRNVRNVHMLINPDRETENFKDECFKRYGTFIKTGECVYESMFDIYIDLNKITDDTKCEIFLRGKSGMLYPDYSFFEANDDVKKLLTCGIDKKIACAVCEVKKT